MIEWARKVGPWGTEIFGPIEIEKGLPPHGLLSSVTVNLRFLAKEGDFGPFAQGIGQVDVRR